MILNCWSTLADCFIMKLKTKSVKWSIAKLFYAHLASYIILIVRGPSFDVHGDCKKLDWCRRPPETACIMLTLT